jgi:hypothetical protein
MDTGEPTGMLMAGDYHVAEERGQVLTSPPAPRFESAWPAGITRVWVGPEYHANRLQDWCIRDGRLECVEAAAAYPLRAVHLLTHSLSDQPGELRMTVRLGPIESAEKQSTETWACFLIGAGGPHIDYRLTALVHHRAARDGGLLAVVDGTGRVAFRDNERNVKGGNMWTITGQRDPKEQPELPATMREGEGFGDKVPREVLLEMIARPDGDGHTLTLSARDPSDGRLLSRTMLESEESRLFDGGLALVSHLGPPGSKRGYWFRDWSISGSKLDAHPERSFGPVLCTQYTLSRGALKLTPQMPPLGKEDTQIAELQVFEAGSWRTVAIGRLVDHSLTIPFRVEDWQANPDMPFRVVYQLRTDPQTTRVCYWQGTIRHEPYGKDQFVIAAFTGTKHFTGRLRSILTRRETRRRCTGSLNLEWRLRANREPQDRRAFVYACRWSGTLGSNFCTLAMNTPVSTRLSASENMATVSMGPPIPYPSEMIRTPAPTSPRGNIEIATASRSLQCASRR